MRRRSVVVFAVVVGCLAGAIAVFPAAAAAEPVEIENALAQNDADDRIDVETRLSVPDSMIELEIILPDEAEVYETNGFERIEEGRYEWTGQTSEPTIRYEYEATIRGTRGDREGVFFVVADEWALVRTPSIDITGSSTDQDVGVERANTVDGEGVAGSHMAYLGAYTEYTGAAEGQEFRLIVPDAANLEEDPAAIVEALEAAAHRLSIGEPTPQVLAFAAPTADHTWAPAGLQRGDAGDMWVRDVERLGTNRDTWVHEYVHTRQRYAHSEDSHTGTTAGTRWTYEGMAEYYAALLPYEAGDITYREFRDKLEEGTGREYDDVRLADPDTWADNDANYDRGALVFAYLDQRLRAAADTTLDAVIAGFNDRDQAFTQERFLDAIEAAGGDEIRSEAKRYTETTDVPPIATQREHAAAFGGPDIRYSIEETTVSGPYRSGALEIPVVVGESVVVTVRVQNAGDESGAYEAELRIDDDPVSAQSGELAAGDSTTLQFTHSFETPGEYDVAVGTDRETVAVEEPADIEVTGLSTEPDDPAPGETITIQATVESAADRPAAGEVVFALDGETIATESVRVADGAATVETSVEIDEPGDFTVSVGGQSTTVTVGDPNEMSPMPIDEQPGFGIPVALVALAATLLAAKRW